MLQPTQFDAVLGGQSNQPKAYDVVLGGKQSVEQAIKALRDPNTYEQAKKVLLAQPKNDLLLRKPKSWASIESILFHSSSWEEQEMPEGFREYTFDTPSTTDNYFQLRTYPREETINRDIAKGLFKEMQVVCQELPQAFNFQCRVYVYGDVNKSRYLSNYRPISNYWDDRRLKMILLP